MLLNKKKKEGFLWHLIGLTQIDKLQNQVNRTSQPRTCQARLS